MEQQRRGSSPAAAVAEQAGPQQRPGMTQLGGRRMALRQRSPGACMPSRQASSRTLMTPPLHLEGRRQQQQQQSRGRMRMQRHVVRGRGSRLGTAHRQAWAPAACTRSRLASSQSRLLP